VYEGNFNDGLKSGAGKFIDLNAGEVFEGTWKQDKKEG